MESSPFVTVAEAAAWLRVSTATVRRWCADGTIPAVQYGKAYRIRKSDLERAAAVGR